jgi:hypothetical protein
MAPRGMHGPWTFRKLAQVLHVLVGSGPSCPGRLRTCSSRWAWTLSKTSAVVGPLSSRFSRPSLNHRMHLYIYILCLWSDDQLYDTTLCSLSGRGYHLRCLQPALSEVPADTWCCPVWSRCLGGPPSTLSAVSGAKDVAPFLPSFLSVPVSNMARAVALVAQE